MTFCYPVEPWEKYKVSYPFLCPKYYEEEGSHHPGVDINLKYEFWDERGPNSDEGHPVLSIANGLVVASGFYPVWGNIVLIRHTDMIYSQYAHLIEVTEKQVGEVVEMGERLGGVGRGENNRFDAHLHFEIRLGDFAPNKWPGKDKAFILANYLDPIVFLQNLME